MPFIAREGMPFVVASVAVATAVNIGFSWALAAPFWLIAAFVIQFFRDPPRNVPDQEGAVVSPADGKVVAVASATNPYTSAACIRVAIFLNVFSVHANRIPVAGTVVAREYRRGRFLNAALDKSSEENERNVLTIRTEDLKEITCVQVAGLVARRILCYVGEGDTVERGERYGFIRFGSRVELFLPATCEVKVGIGDKVKGGSDVVGVMG